MITIPDHLVSLQVLAVDAGRQLTREVFGNIGPASKGVFYALAAASLIICGYGIWRRVRVWRLGQPSSSKVEWRTALQRFRTGVMTQRGVRRGPRLAGRVHALMFWGIVALFIGTVLVAIEEYSAIILGRSSADPVFHKGLYFALYEVALDFFGLLYIAGCAWFIHRRLRRQRAAPSIGHNWGDWVVLILLLTIGVTGYFIEGLRIIREDTPYPGLSFVGFGVASVFKVLGVNQTSAGPVHLVLWWFHAIMVFGVIALLPRTRLLHGIAGTVNIVTTEKRLGRLVPVTLEQLEETGRVGVQHIQDFTRGQLLSLDACVSCGRCQDACPAYEAGKPLSPRNIVQELRRHLDTVASSLSSEDVACGAPTIHGDVIGAETLWSCTTCNACTDVCPLAVDPATLITDLRRHLIGEGALSGPPAAALQKVQRSGNPWGLPKQDRFDWAEGLNVPTVKTNPDFEVLYWIGCAASYDRRAQKVARAVVKLLEIARVNYATLGPEERCTGESARRMGDEFLFQEQAAANIETLTRHKVRKIITHCPHCLNSLKQDYPQFGGEYEVLHHTQFLYGLINEGRLTVPPSTAAPGGTITYHDPCYLARVNGISEEPRGLIEAAAGSGALTEMDRNRCGTSCCGAGGGRMWFDDQPDQRVGVSRVREASETGAKTVAVSCPFCLTMMGDGMAAHSPDVEVRDVAELLAQAIES